MALMMLCSTGDVRRVEVLIEEMVNMFVEEGGGLLWC